MSQQLRRLGYCLEPWANTPQRIEHAGYHRSILQRNPPRYDVDGDLVEVDDEYDEEDDVEAVEENPYGDIQLESTSASSHAELELQAYSRI
jgi:hypothetical protein